MLSTWDKTRQEHSLLHFCTFEVCVIVVRLSRAHWLEFHGNSVTVGLGREITGGRCLHDQEELHAAILVFGVDINWSVVHSCRVWNPKRRDELVSVRVARNYESGWKLERTR